MTTPHDEDDGDGDRATAPDDTIDPADDNATGTAVRPARRRPGLLLSAVAATLVVALATAAVVALRDGSGRSSGSSTAAEPTPTASFVTPPTAQVRPVHQALHDIDATCRAKAGAA